MQNLDLKTQRYNVTPMKRNANGEKELDLEKEQEPNGTTLDYTTLNIIFNYINFSYFIITTIKNNMIILINYLFI